MIDLHTHILPNMDDGSKSPEETAALLKLLTQQGISTVAATPHFYAQEAPDVFLRRRSAALEKMRSIPEAEAMTILPGAEVAYFSGIGSCEALIPLQIDQTRLLLVEMPFGAWSDHVVEDVCEIPIRLGLIPVLAHVNRYPGREQFPKYKDALLAGGAYFQCNTEAFFTFRSRRWALELLKKGYIHFLGSDTHNLTTRPPRWTEARAIIEKKLGENYLEYLDQEARSILNCK